MKSKSTKRRKQQKELPPVSKAMLRLTGIEIEERTGRDWVARGYREMNVLLTNHAAFAAYLEGRA